MITERKHSWHELQLGALQIRFEVPTDDAMRAWVLELIETLDHAGEDYVRTHPVPEGNWFR